MTASERAASGERRPPRAAWLSIGLALGMTLTLAAVLVLDVWASEPASSGPLVPRFVDDTVPSGVDHVYDGEFRFFVGGGLAVFDCDDDGLPEVYLAGGAGPAALYRNVSEVGGTLAFRAEPSPATDLSEVMGAYPLDIDGDGHLDLVVLRAGENVLLQGRGACRFERANERWHFEGGNAVTTAFSATWEPGADLPTLAFGNYLDPADDQRATCAPNVLVRPGRGGYGPPAELSPSWCSLSMLFSDWSRSGRRDLRVSNDRHYTREGTEQLWRLAAGEPPRLYTEQDGWQPLRIWGMGIASHDLTGDGRPEVFLTSQGDNKLQVLAGDGERPEYRDIAIERGVTAHRPHAGGDVLPSTAWHAEFQDVNNDGDVDLFVAKGNVEVLGGTATRDPNNLLLGQPDGTFVEAALEAGIVGFERSRGAALADLNLDGSLDVVVVNRRETVRFWRNVGPGSAEQPQPVGNHLRVALEQDGPNRSALGAWIELVAGDRTTWRELTVGGGHASGSAGWQHLGLGDAAAARIRIHWPDGEVGPWLEVSANRSVVLVRGADVPRTWAPGDAVHGATRLP
jgi:enediyne biosynthesis protein E4